MYISVYAVIEVAPGSGAEINAKQFGYDNDQNIKKYNWCYHHQVFHQTEKKLISLFFVTMW